MLLSDCKCCSGFFAVICLLPFSLLLLPPLFPSCPAAVPAVVLSAVSAGLALFPWLFPPLFCRFLRRTSRAVPRALSRPVPPRTASGQPPFRARNPHWGLYERPLQRNFAAALLPNRACYAASGRETLRECWPGESCGDSGPENLAGCLSGVFCMGARDPRVVRLPGRAGLDVYRIRFRT